jgi:DNA-binding MarR family transcriptional regulator
MGRETKAPDKRLIGLVVWQTARSVARHLNVRLARLNLNGGLYPFFRALYEEDGLTQSQLAERVQMRSSRVVVVVRELEQKRWIKKTKHPRDRRKVFLHLTTAGRRFYRMARPEVLGMTRQLLRGIAGEERETLLQLLDRVRKNAEAPPK